MDLNATADLIIKVISNLGFPIFVAVYLLIFMKKAQEDTTKALHDLTDAIEALRDQMVRTG